MNEEDNKRRREILEQLARDPDMINKMNKDQRNEILELLRTEVDRIAEENKRGEGIMDQIERYTDNLSEKDRKRFYEDLNERSKKQKRLKYQSGKIQLAKSGIDYLNANLQIRRARESKGRSRLYKIVESKSRLTEPTNGSEFR